MTAWDPDLFSPSRYLVISSLAGINKCPLNPGYGPVRVIIPINWDLERKRRSGGIFLRDQESSHPSHLCPHTDKHRQTPGKVRDPPGGTIGSILKGLVLEQVLFAWLFSLG